MKQIEGNYTKIPNQVLECIIKSNFKATQYKILLTIIRYTYGFNRKDHHLSVSFISRATDISRRYISKELQELIENKILIVSEEYSVRSSRKLKINENINQWVGYGTTVPQVNHSSTGELEFNTTGEPQFHRPGEPQFTQETKKEIKTKQRGKSEKSSHSTTKKEEIENYFAKIWDLYPRKLGKSKVSDKQKKKLYEEIPFEQMLQAIERYKKEVKERPEEFIMYGSTFFNTSYKDYIREQEETPKETRPIIIGSYDEKVKQLEEEEIRKYGIRWSNANNQGV